MTERHQTERKQSHRNPLQRLVAHLADHLPFIQPKPVETLSTLFQRDTGKPAAKWQGYLQHYDRHFAELKDQPLRILEIGVQAGGSLEVWAQYFKSATLIIGCDIDPACGAQRYDDPRIKVLIGDINTPETLQSLAALTDTLDVVIDDGSHHSSDIIRSFVQLFPRLSEEGTYLIEDLHCSYWESYGGGLYDPFSAIAFFKKIVDLVNRPAWGVDVDVKDFMAEFSAILGDASPETARTEIDWSFLEDIHSIEFVNSICVIHKRAANLNVLGPLVLSGARENANNHFTQYVAGEMSVPTQRTNLLSTPPKSTTQADTQLFFAREEIARLKQEFGDLQLQNISLTSQFYEATKKFYDASVTIQQLEFKLKQLEKPNPDES
jgi:hypothetical protein